MRAVLFAVFLLTVTPTSLMAGVPVDVRVESAIFEDSCDADDSQIAGNVADLLADLKSG